MGGAKYMYVWVKNEVDRWVGGRMNGWIDEWMRWLDGWMGGQMDR